MPVMSRRAARDPRELAAIDGRHKQITSFDTSGAIDSDPEVIVLPAPLTLGSDRSGVVEGVGPGVTEFNRGDEVYGVTNPQFVGAQADYAIAVADMIAPSKLPLAHRSEWSAPRSAELESFRARN